MSHVVSHEPRKVLASLNIDVAWSIACLGLHTVAVNLKQTYSKT